MCNIFTDFSEIQLSQCWSHAIDQNDDCIDVSISVVEVESDGSRLLPRTIAVRDVRSDAHAHPAALDFAFRDTRIGQISFNFHL
jgi:hypothetical protein